MKKAVGISLLILTFAFLPPTAQALTLSDSLHVFDGPFPPGYSLAGDPTSVTQQIYLASPFRTDSAAYTLHEVTLMLMNFTMSNPGIPVVDLYTGSGSGPGARIATLAWESPGILPGSGGPAYAAVDFLADDIYLAASTSYWIVLHSAFGDIIWSEARRPPEGLSTGGWPTCYGAGFLPGMAYSTGGQSWWSSGDDLVLRMEVEAEPVPEPATMLLLGSGLAGAGIMRIRRKFKK